MSVKNPVIFTKRELAEGYTYRNVFKMRYVFVNINGYKVDAGIPNTAFWHAWQNHNDEVRAVGYYVQKIRDKWYVRKRRQ